MELIIRSQNIDVVMETLKCFGTALASNKEEVSAAVKLSIVPELGRLLGAQDMAIRKEAAWVLSNITAESAEELKPVFNTGTMGKLIVLTAKDADEVKKECIWAISNATNDSNAEQTKALITLGATEVFCSFLGTKDLRLLSIVLEGITNLLSKTKELLGEEELNALGLKIEDCDGLKAIENFQEHPNTVIYQKAVNLIEEFFGVEDIKAEEPSKSISIFDY